MTPLDWECGLACGPGLVQCQAEAAAAEVRGDDDNDVDNDDDDYDTMPGTVCARLAVQQPGGGGGGGAGGVDGAALHRQHGHRPGGDSTLSHYLLVYLVISLS